MKVLKIKEIRLDGQTQCRKSIDPKWVKDYAENMKEGYKYPNPVVFFDGKVHWLADGFHRLSAHKSNGATEIEVDVKDGTVREARLYAIRENNRHGKNMSFDEKRNNIIMMLKDEEWGKWSDERIAKEVSTSKMSVFRMRKKLRQAGEIEPKKSTSYIKNGKEVTRPVGSKENPENNTENKEENKEEKSDDKQDDYNPEEAAQQEMAHTIAELTQKVEDLKEQLALGNFDGNEFEKFDIQEMLAQLKERNRILELENKTLRDSRDQYQYENAQLIKEVKTLRAKLKKAE
jgi:hypothetical protein